MGVVTQFQLKMGLTRSLFNAKDQRRYERRGPGLCRKKAASVPRTVGMDFSSCMMHTAILCVSNSQQGGRTHGKYKWEVCHCRYW